jgi:anthranilate phosphoribosyltransferase
VAELVDGRVSEREVTPASLGLEPHPLEGLRGGTPADNAALVLRVLEGTEGGGARSAVVMNAGAAIYVSGRSGSLRDAVGEAAEALGSGAALRTLHALADASHA